MDKRTESKIIKHITEKRNITKPFNEIIGGFEDKFSELNLTEHCFNIADYFYYGAGQVTATKKLIEHGHIKNEWLRNSITETGKTKKDFKGLYVFLYGKKPFYVGISKGVIARVIQHIKGYSHNVSSLAFKIGLKKYELLNQQKYEGSRNEIDFKKEIEPIKEFLSRQKIAWLNIENNEELFLFEVFCSMKLRTMLNEFETH